MEKKAGMKDRILNLVYNTIMTRTELVQRVIDGGNKDLNDSCGYPPTIDAKDYALLYSREGVAARVVNIYPEESWAMPPEVYETEDPEDETDFEKEWKILVKKFRLYNLFTRADTLSGIGRFGIILIGIGDGRPLSSPIEGISETGERIGKTSPKKELLYLRPFQESVLTIDEFEKNINSPRYGLPKQYSINFYDNQESISQKVHWHRVVHLADNREMSDIYGVPRMQRSYNRLLDVRKILGGSGEMFWKGGFPGYSFEVNNDSDPTDLDTASLREEMTNYMLGLQRYLALQGVTAKSLAPQVADPQHHIDAQLLAIAIAEGIPQRILYGSERGELASSQDAKAWERRVRKRQESYLSPMVIRPFIDKMILLGVLPDVDNYFVKWPDLATQTDREKADTARLWAESLSKYVAGDVSQVIPVAEFLRIFGNLPSDQVKQITEAVGEYIDIEYKLGAEDKEGEDK